MYVLVSSERSGQLDLFLKSELSDPWFENMHILIYTMQDTYKLQRDEVGVELDVDMSA